MKTKLKNILLLLLFIPFSAFCEQAGYEQTPDSPFTLPTLSSEAEPLLTIDNCVNVQSGNFYQTTPDIYIKDPDTLFFSRCYDTGQLFSSEYGLGMGAHYPLNAVYQGHFKSRFYYLVDSRQGCPNAYIGSTQNQIDIEADIDKRYFSYGLTNCSAPDLSGKTSSSNIHVQCNDWQKNVYSECTVQHGDGSRYLYEQLSPNSKIFLLKLTEETRSNGRKLHFFYDEWSRLSKIRLKDPQGKYVFGHITLNYSKDNSKCTIHAHNGQKVTYHTRKEKCIAKGPLGRATREINFLHKVESSHQPTIHYELAPTDRGQGFCKIGTVDQGNGRVLKVSYDAKSGKVRHLKRPVGNDKELVTTYTIDYKKKYTDVFDFQGTKTRYNFTKYHQLDSILHYAKQDEKDQLAYSEKFLWGKPKSEQKGQLLAKALCDEEDHALLCRSFTYDSKGNVSIERCYGNITGQAPKSFKLNEKFLPENSKKIECNEVRNTYSNDGRNLLLSKSFTNGTKLLFTYLPDSDLLTKQLTLSHGAIQERTFHEYDEQATLVCSIVDDGSGNFSHDLSNVTYRRISKWKPNYAIQSASYGKPLEKTELYYDLSSKSEQQLKRITYQYDSRGRCIQESIYDASNQWCYDLSTEYDARDRITKKVDALGQITLFEYDLQNNLVRTEEIGSGTYTKYEYDYSNRLTAEKIYHDDGSCLATRYSYDARGLCVSMTDPRGNKTNHQYDRLGRLIKKLGAPVLTYTKNTKRPPYCYEYDTLGNVVKTIDPSGKITHSTYNSLGQKTSIKYPDGSSEDFLYDLNSQLIRKKNKNNSFMYYERDYRGRVLKQEHRSQNGRLIDTSFNKYKGELLVESINPYGTSTRYQYDGAGRKINEQIFDCENQIISNKKIKYDKLGQEWKVTDYTTSDLTEALVYINEKDFLQRITEERTEDLTNEVFSKKTYQYDRVGNITRTKVYIDHENYDEEICYFDSHGKPCETINSRGTVNYFFYDREAKSSTGLPVLRITQVDPKGLQNIREYDSYSNELTNETKDSLGNSLACSKKYYDLCQRIKEEVHYIYEGQQLTGTQTHQFHYDSLGRKTTECILSEKNQKRETHYSYDLQGLLSKIHTPAGIDIYHQYDETGQITRLYSSDGSVDYKYEYANSPHPTCVIDQVNANVNEYSYHPLGQITAEQINGVPLQKTEHDLSGRTKKIVFSDDSEQLFTYKGPYVQRVLRKFHNNRQDYEFRVLEHNWKGQALKQIECDGETQSISQWDPLNRRIQHQNSYFKEQIPSNGFDACGNLEKHYIELAEKTFEQHFAYDLLGHLIEEEGPHNHSYKCNSIDARISHNKHTHIRSSFNEIVNDGQIEYQYDENGCLTKWISDKEIWVFQYDALSRLTEIHKNGSLLQKMAYNSLGQVIQVTNYPTEEVLYVIHIDSTEIGLVNEGQQIVDFKVKCPDNTQHTVVAIESRAQTFWINQDWRANICQLIDIESQELVSSTLFSAFGEELHLEQSAHCNWGFSGHYKSSDTGLYRIGQRYYNPKLGSWMSPDPSSFSDGPNLYAYTHHQPLMYQDPTGLESVVIGEDRSGSYRKALTTPVRSFDRWESVTGKNYSRNYEVPATGQVNPKRGIGFINGINNRFQDAYESSKMISEISEGAKIYGTYNATQGICYDIIENMLGNAFVATPPTDRLLETWNDFFSNAPKDAKFLQICHSGGTTHVDLALLVAPESTRNRIEVLAVSPRHYIREELCQNVRHVCSKYDPITYLDVSGRIDCSRYTDVIAQHKDASTWFDHSFNSPTFQNSITQKIQEFMKVSQT